MLHPNNSGKHGNRHADGKELVLYRPIHLVVILKCPLFVHIIIDCLYTTLKTINWCLNI
jgi:hypothetical protein